jgi:ribosome-associated translation inhibitor RaiA/cold shock CspA family protein
MQTELRVNVQGTTLSEPLKNRIAEKFSQLDRFYGRITGCKVSVTESRSGRRHGRLFSVRVAAALPRGTLVVNRQSGVTLYVAIREAFDAMRRRIQDHARVLRGQIKAHKERPLARVIDLDRAQGFGFLRTVGGRELYFHRNSVLGGTFDRLRPGSAVHFTEGDGDAGPQASTVRPAGRVRSTKVARV